ncbi:SMEK domain-containing protein [Bradyrhizobium sp. SSUT77]|uniref:SMEK domain-containing protein n=1 Tax=Bradyrhizobium sp. SSUT77 TaxID=3040603 RepID=UPI002447424D|nr:SMEK domain-containing protein [Bradyrhizobium sp. SSUT77]MDH2345143.1 SMEK domain-containing protein [Bradyrhizobium sp. SSUT77]
MRPPRGGHQPGAGGRLHPHPEISLQPPHLTNLNRKQKNFPGIDLGDDHDRVAFQVTSSTTLEKVKFTVRQFMDRAYYNTFDELFILVLARKQFILYREELQRRHHARDTT